MTKSLLTTAALALSLAGGAACAQPAGGIGTSSNSSGGVVGAGTLNSTQPGTGIINNSGTGIINNSGTGTIGNSGMGASPSPSTLPGSNENLGTMPSTPSTSTPSTPNLSPSGSVPGANQP